MVIVVTNLILYMYDWNYIFLYKDDAIYYFWKKWKALSASTESGKLQI